MEKLPVPGFPTYEIDAEGNVYNIKTGRCLKATPNRNGYYKVGLYRNGKADRHVKYIHRLVAEVFLGVCPDGLVVRHGDGNKAHNAVDNLSYGTHKDNYDDAVRHGTRGNDAGPIGAWQSAKTHCPKGHEYTEENIYWSKRGWRNCRICIRSRSL